MAKDKKRKKTAGGKGLLQTGRSDDAPAWLIQRTARLLRVLFLRLVQDEGGVDLTPEMWTVLTRLVARDGQYQSELAAATYRDRPNMSHRRKTRIYLTPRAREVVAATAPLAMRTRDRLYEGLKKKELKALRRALRIVEANTLSVLNDLEKEAPPE